MAMATSFSDIQDLFHTLPQTKFEIETSLEAEWLRKAVADYELNLGVDLQYDLNIQEFGSELSMVTQRTLAQMMYVFYLERELSRVMALTGIYGKDIQLTGQDATKRVTKQELDSQIQTVEKLLHSQKKPSYN